MKAAQTKTVKTLRTMVLGAGLLAALFLGACGNPVNPAVPSPDLGGGSGSARALVRIYAGAERTLLPEQPDIDHYRLNFTGGGDLVSVTADAAEAGGLNAEDGGLAVELSPGTWSLEVTGYDAADTPTPLVRGSAGGLVLTEGQTTAVAVTLSPIGSPDGEGTGTFSWAVTLDGDLGEVLTGGVEIAAAALTITGSGSLSFGMNLVNAGDVAEGEFELPSGYYDAVLEITLSDGRRAGYQTSAHIYQGLETQFQHTLWAEDFAALVKIGGSVTINGAPGPVSGVSVELIDGEDLDSAVPIAGAYGYTASAGDTWTWIGAVPVNAGPVYFKVSAVMDGKTYTVLGKTDGAVNVEAVPEAGQENIALSLSFLPLSGLSLSPGYGSLTARWDYDWQDTAWELYCMAGIQTAETLKAPENKKCSEPSGWQYTIGYNGGELDELLEFNTLYSVLVIRKKPGYVEVPVVVQRTTHRAPVTGVSAVSGPGTGQITLTWTNPTDPDFTGVEINGRDTTTSTVNSPETTVTIGGLVPGRSYLFDMTNLYTGGIRQYGYWTAWAEAAR